MIGDMRHMSTEWLRAVSFAGYGLTLSVAIGVPIPILDEEMVRSVSVTDDDLKAPVIEYSQFYPYGEGEGKLGEVTYKDLKSGIIRVKDQDVPTGSFSSYAKALEVAQYLKHLIQNGDFFLTQWQAPLPGADTGKEATT